MNERLERYVVAAVLGGLVASGATVAALVPVGAPNRVAVKLVLALGLGLTLRERTRCGIRRFVGQSAGADRGDGSHGTTGLGAAR